SRRHPPEGRLPIVAESYLAGSFDMTPLSNEAGPGEGILAAGARETARVAPQNPGRKWRIWGAACFLVLVIAAFNQSLFSLMRYAVGSDLYSYILLVPFVSVYLLWVRREQFAKNYVTNLGLTAVFLIAAVVLLVVSSAWQSAAPEANKPERLALVTLSFLCCVAGGGFSSSAGTGCDQQLSRWSTSFSWYRCRIPCAMHLSWPLSPRQRRWPTCFFT